MKTRDKPKILCLGMSYADIVAQMDAENFRDGILINKERGVPQVVECVRRSILTEMDGRDLARCIAMENKHRVEAYTVSQELGAEYNASRHLHANFNRASFPKSIRKAFGEDCQFQQIILDYFWIPKGAWVISHWSKALFRQTLPDLASFLEHPEKRCNSSLDCGVIFLPFCYHVFKELVSAMSILDKHYEISFVRKNDLKCHALWSGTQAIDPTIMQERFGKQFDQEESYCTFSKRDVRQSMDDSSVRKDEVIRFLQSIGDVENVRMIRLKPISLKPISDSQMETEQLGESTNSTTSLSRNVSVTKIICHSRKVSDCSETDSADSSTVASVEKSARNIFRCRSTPGKTPNSETRSKRSSLLLKGKKNRKKRQRPSMDSDENIDETSRKRSKSADQQSKLYTIAEDLETYQLFDKDEEISSYYEISNTAKESLFPDFRRSYWDIINNKHVSRPHCMTTIQMLNATTHDSPWQSDVRGNKYEKSYCERFKIQETAAKLLLLNRQVQLYPCVHPKVVDYEDKEEIDTIRMKIRAQLKCSKRQARRGVKLRERASLLAG